MSGEFFSPDRLLVNSLKNILEDIQAFSEFSAGIQLRSYQAEAAAAIVDSVLNKRGRSFVVMFPRQSGKNELQAQIEGYLLMRTMDFPVEIVKVAPTLKPQALTSMRRLEKLLSGNPLVRWVATRELGTIYRMRRGRIYFISAHPQANIVGATASLLLSVDEAQEVLPEKFDKDLAPMAASTAATRVFWGTAWTSQTLLGRELRLALEAEGRDGVRRVFRISADEVAGEVPAYARYVQEQLSRLGRQHPLVKTQYFSEEIDEGAGLFPPDRLRLMQGDHLPQAGPEPGVTYALLVDVAGEAEQPLVSPAQMAESQRDSTAATLVQVELASLSDPAVQAPVYRAVWRREWVGVKHASLYGKLQALAELWRAVYIVVDATGVGAGLASFLERRFPGKVLPQVFSLKSKSDLGWAFLAVVESGRYREPLIPPDHPELGEQAAFQRRFWAQARACTQQVMDGPGRLLRWSVPEGQRDPVTGERLHDDLLFSAALCAALEGRAWQAPGKAILIRGRDPLEEIDKGMRDE